MAASEEDLEEKAALGPGRLLEGDRGGAVVEVGRQDRSKVPHTSDANCANGQK